MSTSYSIIICTRNRAESLTETLKSIAQLALPADGSVELMIVDNGSTDHTRAVVDRFDHAGFTVSYLVENKPGVANARTTALQRARGDILLWTDDDVRVPRDWIQGMARPILEDGAMLVAGGVDPAPHLAERLGQRPLSAFRGWFACTDHIDPDKPNGVVGANMAMHKDAKSFVPAFDPELGPGAPKTGFAEEVLFARQLADQNQQVVTALDVRVTHHFDESRLTPDAVLETARKMGNSHAYVFHHWNNKVSRGIWPRYVFAFLNRVVLRTLKLDKVNDFPSEKRIRTEKDIAFARCYREIRRTPMKYRK